MKNALKGLCLLAVVWSLLFISVSCDDDDDSTSENQEMHTVEYKLTVNEPAITRISYRNAGGTMVNAQETLTGLTTWSKPVSDVDAPFNARLEMEVEVPVGSSINYTMGIYVDGVLKHSSNGPTSGTADIELEYQFN